MFGRSSVAIVGLDLTSLPEFQSNLQDKVKLLELSQFAASIINKVQGEATTGINPFGNPRLDEKEPEGEIDLGAYYILGKHLHGTAEEQELNPLTSDLAETFEARYGSSEEEFSIGHSKYGFWVVLSESKDVSDPASRREQQSYDTFTRPFKYLGKDEKAAVEEAVQASAVTKRTQFPVIVDFQHGRVYIESTNADAIISVRELLSLLGAKTFGLRWDFKDATWITSFFKYVQENTHFTTEMQQRADDLARFRPDEIEKFEDKNMEKIVQNFFSLSELGTGLWVGLSTPARIKLHATSEPVSTAGVSSAFELLHKYDDSEVISSPVVFQELVAFTTKQGIEKQARYDLFTLDINDGINMQDVGAAMLKGFDLPRFKREVKQVMKSKGELSVKDFWQMWTQGMHDAILTFVDNITEALELDKGFGLKEFDETEIEEIGE